MSSAAVETGEYGYETVYLLRARQGHPLDIPAIQAHLESIGDSVLVAGDGELAKVHVHNDRPDGVISYGLTIGTLSRITIENLDGQAHDVREAKATAFLEEGGAGTRGPRDGRGRGRRGEADATDAAAEPAPAGHRRGRPVGRPRGALRRARRGLQGVRRGRASCAAARAPTRAPASSSRRSRTRPPTSS